MNILVTLVEDYERKHYPMDFPDADAIETIKFIMEQRNLTVKDLVPIDIHLLNFGSEASASLCTELKSHFERNYISESLYDWTNESCL